LLCNPLALNSPSSCLSPPNAGITGLHHYTCPCM
jgi:hypothetical protein